MLYNYKHNNYFEKQTKKYNIIDMTEGVIINLLIVLI